jgi:hypothetical protein
MCFLSGNITLVVFLATSVIFPLKKHTSAVFLLSLLKVGKWASHHDFQEMKRKDSAV